MVEPACARRGVDLRGVPRQWTGVVRQCLARPQVLVAGGHLSGEFAVVGLLRLFCGAFGLAQRSGNDRPFVGSNGACLVATPAHVRAAHGDNRLGCQRADRVVDALPVIDLHLAVGTLAARAVQPHREDGSVVGEQLDELVDIKVVVGLALAIRRLRHVPGRQIHAELQAVTRRRVRYLTHEVALATLPRGGGHGVPGVGRRPQAEPVMVLAREDHAGHASAHECAHPLIDIDVSRVEQCGILVALAPLAVRHRVHAEVDERVHLHLLPLELTVGRPNIGQVVLVDHAYGFRLMAGASAGPAPCRFLTKDSPAVNWSPA